MWQMRGMLALLAGVSVLAPAFGESIEIPNFSFESPPVVRDKQNPFGALPFLDDWDESAVGLADEFDQNTGVFLNSDAPSPDRITNAHLDRLAFISSLIGNDLRQELVATFQPGWSYDLTVGVATSLVFPVGSTEELEVALYYVDGGMEHVIASTTVAGGMVNTISLIDVSVNVPPVGAEDPWAGRPIGILIRPSVDDPDDSDSEGFWDADFVRLVATDSATPIVGDFDGDGDVDLSDIAALQRCFGPVVGFSACNRFDADGNLEIDGLDLPTILDALDGPGIPTDDF